MMGGIVHLRDERSEELDISPIALQHAYIVTLSAGDIDACEQVGCAYLSGTGSTRSVSAKTMKVSLTLRYH